jgi:uncharacterized protein YndB with AHSA1/START domain
MNTLVDGEIRHVTFVRAAPERGYAAFTRAPGLEGWFTQGASVEARPGGEIRFRWVEWGPDRVSAEDGSPVLEASHPRRFVFRWQPDDPSYFTTVEVDFEAVEDGTVVLLREHGFRDTPAGRHACLDCGRLGRSAHPAQVLRRARPALLIRSTLDPSISLTSRPRDAMTDLDLSIHPLTPDRWDDLETLFGPRGAIGGCWCMWWRQTRSEYDRQKGEGNRQAMRAIVASGEIPGLLAYSGGRPVAWCSVAPRTAYPSLDRSRVLQRVDDQPVWSIVCSLWPGASGARVSRCA